MVSVKAHFKDGKIELPPDFSGHDPCEVTVLFPEEAAPKRRLGDSEAFRRAVGGWHDIVDCEALKRMIYESRKDIARRGPAQWPDAEPADE